MTRNGQFCLICNFSNLFPPKWLRMTWNGQFCLIRNFSNLFPPKWLRMTQNSQFHLIHKFSNLPTKMAQNDSEWPILSDSQLFQFFPPKWLRMTWNGQFCLIHNFSNLFPLKWLRMTQNSQFHLIHKFSNLPTKMAQNDSEWPILSDSQLFQLFPSKWLRMTQNGQFCMARIKYTLIQGNFYEGLLFYMDSCALSPMASLLSLVSLSWYNVTYIGLCQQRPVGNNYWKLTPCKGMEVVMPGSPSVVVCSENY